MSAGHPTYRGPVVFALGFRSFFLLAGVWAALALPIWVIAYLGAAPLAASVTRAWHVHEMLFGYVPAVMAGFLLTAIPNWTGRAPLVGWPLMLLAGLWLAGRLAMLGAPETILGAAIDVAFLALFAGIVGREIVAAGNWRNLPVVFLLATMALANATTHLQPVHPEVAAGAERLGLGAIAMMIALIGGRVTPAFTRNWLVQRGASRLPAAEGSLDWLVLGLTGLAAILWAALPDQPASGVALVLAGLGNLVRLARWRGAHTLAEPLLSILHVGFGWLGLGLVLTGAALLWPEAVPPSAGIHAITAGAIGVMTLAVMSRAVLGHTGRPLSAGPATGAIYLFVNLAAGLRLAAALLLEQAVPLLTASVLAWCMAFTGFCLVYGPMLVRPRLDPTAGMATRPLAAAKD